MRFRAFGAWLNAAGGAEGAESLVSSREWLIIEGDGCPLAPEALIRLSGPGRVLTMERG